METDNTMTNTYASQIQTGTDVYGSDDEKIGSIAGVADNYFVIEKGFIFTTDIYVPMSAVASADADRVTLSMTKDQVENEDWTNQPSDDTYAAGASTGTTDDTYADIDTGTQAGTVDDTYATGSTTNDSVIERSEERLVVDKATEQTGQVRVGKHVVEERQTVDVPVTREEVTIDRRPVDRPVGDASFTDEAIEVPVYAEDVDVDKESRVVEELEVGKTQVTDTARVEETVRREEFDIDGDTGTTRQNR
jgi:uncharacterized protein (TIGR02271 family)